MDRTFNTLFMLSSLDGKISTGSVDDRDVDKDYKNILGIKEGLHQYYDLEKETDFFSLNSGKVMAKIGANTKFPINNPYVTFVIIDNSHLTEDGVRNMIAGLKQLIIVTKNQNHPAFNIKDDKLHILSYENEVNFEDMFQQLKSEYSAERVTIQSGGSLNAEFLRNNLIDEVSIVITPALIGGGDTASLVDGESLVTDEDLNKIRSLELINVKQLENSYLHLRYKVNNA